MTEHIAEYGHFKKNITPEELKEFHKSENKMSKLEIKRKVQKIFRDGGMEISLDEIF